MMVGTSLSSVYKIIKQPITTIPNAFYEPAIHWDLIKNIFLYVFGNDSNWSEAIIIGFRLWTSRILYHSTFCQSSWLKARTHRNANPAMGEKCHFSFLRAFHDSTFRNSPFSIPLLIIYIFLVLVICLFNFPTVLALLVPSYHLHVKFVFHLKC